MIVTGRPTTVACSTRAQPRAVQKPSYRGVNRYPLGKQMVVDLPVRDPILRAPVRHTESSLRRGVRRGGHIVRGVSGRSAQGVQAEPWRCPPRPPKLDPHFAPPSTSWISFSTALSMTF